MAKHAVVKHNFKSYKDEYTGKTVLRLTSPEYLSHHPYFYNKIFTNDSRYLIHVMEIAGVRNYYKMDLNEGISIQLTDGINICDYSANLSNDDKFLFYCIGNNIVKLDMATLEEEIIYITPKGWLGYDNPGISNDDKYIVTVEMLESDKLVSKGWDSFEEQWAKKPCCRLVYIDVEKKIGNIIHQENCWLGHPQIRPYNNNMISFCHEGPANKIDARLWMINSDGTKMQCLRPQDATEMISHEYWLADGSLMAYVYRTQEKTGKATEELVDTETFMPKGEGGQLKEKIMLMNPDKLEEEYLMDCSKFCHFISDKTNKRIVGDGQLPEQHFIYLVDVNKRSEEKLCSHGTSWKTYGTTQDAHPHPVFSPDSNKVVFTSDKEGSPCIYLISL